MYKKLRSRPVAAMILYLMLYQLTFTALERWSRPFHIMHCRLDDWIPFSRFAVAPYVLWFAWVPLMLLWFLRRDRSEFCRLFLTIAGGTAFALCIFAVYPTAQLRRRTLYGSDVFTSLIRFIYQADTPTNVCPSLHVFVSLAVLLAVLGSGLQMARGFKLFNVLAALSISASTVIIRQHSCVDVFWGAVLAAAAYWLADRYMARRYGPWPAERRIRLQLRRA